MAALAPFRVRSFRFQWPADLATSWAQEMETLILGWYVLVATESVLLLALFASLQFLGTLLAPMFGVIGDRIGHRNLLCVLRLVYTALAATLMGLGLSGSLTPAHAFAIAALAGLVRPSDLVMRNALVGDTMPGNWLMNAMGLSRATADSARVAGALVGAGLFAALGIGPAYVAVAGCYLLGCALTLGVAKRPSATAPAVRVSPWSDLKAGLAYVWNTPRLLALMWLAFLVNLCGYPLTNGLLPYVVRQIYGADQTWLGYLVAGYAAGALAASLLMAATGWPARPLRAMLLGILVWYALLLLFGFVRDAGLGLALLVVIGATQSIAMISMAVSLLRTAGPAFRGRVMGARMLAVYGLPIGLTASGWLIGAIGFAPTVALYCLTGLLFTAVIAIRWHAVLWQDG
jgi:MFS family permease